MESTISFERWIQYIFDRPVTQPRWYWDDSSATWTDEELDLLTPALVTKLLTETFERSGEVLRRFSDAQVGQAIWFANHDYNVNFARSMLEEEVPWPERKRCIRSIHTLFADCFAHRCTPYLSHADEPGAGGLNAACYMWWDIFPTWGQPEDPGRAEADAELLDVMCRTLELDSDACREAALHGLGHWHLNYAEEVKQIINAFLERKGGTLRPELIEYARAARIGMVQ